MNKFTGAFYPYSLFYLYLKAVRDLTTYKWCRRKMGFPIKHPTMEDRKSVKITYYTSFSEKWRTGVWKKERVKIIQKAAAVE